MRKTLTALATAATVAAAAVAAPSAAEAHHFFFRGPGFVGGVVAGGLIASAFAPRYYGYYGYPYPYYGPYGCWRQYWNGSSWVGYRAC
jgi:hypothetical protein